MSPARKTSADPVQTVKDQVSVGPEVGKSPRAPPLPYTGPPPLNQLPRYYGVPLPPLSAPLPSSPTEYRDPSIADPWYGTHSRAPFNIAFLGLAERAPDTGYAPGSLIDPWDHRHKFFGPLQPLQSPQYLTPECPTFTATYAGPTGYPSYYCQAQVLDPWLTITSQRVPLWYPLDPRTFSSEPQYGWEWSLRLQMSHIGLQCILL
ncbi:hypothetical protein DFH07DRAFT_977353 [Mycena maculata]|uniref:Uncharacterized protein n=1 Tax=Mycena maculata TaxID=230809 RepID=A0AAD7N421_9AGAR|nr:hypothetical protein DFH07DRAFT_977353 [Mycena maculata]